MFQYVPQPEAGIEVVQASADLLSPWEKQPSTAPFMLPAISYTPQPIQQTVLHI